MVQSLGISVGNLNSYVAAGQGGGIEILLNEYSNRATPSMVAFTDHSRSIGVDASSNQMMNLKNTIYDLMVLLGKSYKEIDSSYSYPFKLEEASDGQPMVVVRHLGEERKFTITQVLAMLFTKLRGIAYDATDCVISCPQFFNEQQKDALLQAALLSGLNPLQIISDMSAVVLNYAYYRTTKEDTHKFIAFINLGQSNLQCCLAWLTPKEDIVRVLAAESEQIGGKDFDKLLADHFVKESNLNLNTKQYLKLVSSCEKLKKLLSSNANEIPIHVESLISEDKDFTARIDRANFELIGQHLLQRVETCMRRTLDNAKINFDRLMNEVREQAKAAEVARGTEAAKAVEAAKKAEAAKAAKAEAAKAAAEAVKAAAAAAATPPPADATNGTQQEPAAEGDTPAAEGDTPAAEGEAQTQNASNVPKTEETAAKQPKDAPQPMDSEPEELTKAKAEEARAVQAAKTAKAAEKAIASQANKLTKLAEVKFDLQTVEMVGGSTRIPAIKQLVQTVFNIAPSTTLNTDEAVARGCVLHCATLHPGTKVKREVRILGSESFYTRNGRVTCDKDMRRVELELITSDRKYKQRTEARNNLEEYIYSTRSKLQEGDQFLDDLNAKLEWLFSDEGEDASEDDYNSMLNDIKKASDAKLVENNNK